MTPWCISSVLTARQLVRPRARRHGRGLGPRGLQRLASGVASLTAAEAAFCVAVLDRHGAGSVTMDDILEGMATVGAESWTGGAPGLLRMFVVGQMFGSASALCCVACAKRPGNVPLLTSAEV